MYVKSNPLRIVCNFDVNVDTAKLAMKKALKGVGLTRKQYSISSNGNGSLILEVPNPFSKDPKYTPASITEVIKDYQRENTNNHPEIDHF